MTASPSPRNTASSLPSELLSLIYGPLSQPDLLAAAGVSSWWRTNAICDQNYYRAWTVLFPKLSKPSLLRASEYADIYRLVSIIDDAETHQYHLGLSIHIDLSHDDQPGSYGDSDSDDLIPSYFSSLDDPSADADGQMVAFSLMEGPNSDEARIRRNMSSFQEVVLPILLRALPRAVLFNIHACSDSLPLLWAGLASPAPALRKLEIRPVVHIDGGGNYSPLPENFLAGSAARLTGVSLLMIPVSSSTPVFPSVRRLQVIYPYVAPDLDVLFACFPNICDLDLRCLPNGLAVGPRACTLFRRLHTLRLGWVNLDGILGSPPRRIQVPFIEYWEVTRYDASALVRPSSAGPLSVRIFEHMQNDYGLDDEDSFYRTRGLKPTRFTRLCLQVSSTNAVRRVDSDIPFDSTIHLLGRAGCAEQITQLSVDDRHVRSLIERCKNMPVLSVLRIDLLTWYTLSPIARLTEDEAALYDRHHVRSDCKCLGGPFADDHHDGGPPDVDCRVLWPSLQTIVLSVTRSDSTIARRVLRGLAETFTPDHGRPLTLVLSNGLELAEDAAGHGVEPAVFDIRRPDSQFCPWLESVGRAAGLIAAAARKRILAKRAMDRLLRDRGPYFHRDECRDAESSKH
ncbi:hypothetical protein AURDEDRAFT_163448 [Auricularia subglabra TFB-10046 SS5]|nr:hypothetical protein AURDEDRAFT_163448 [Auricularia subglabra TFB-10046 SS5]